MFCLKLKTATAICVSLTVMAMALAADRNREPRKPADVSGTISAISADGKVLTVKSGGGRNEEPKLTEVKLTDKTKTEFVGVGKELNRKLKVGDGVAVTLNGGSAAAIEASAAPDVTGKITAVSADGKTITVERTIGRAESQKFDIKIDATTHMVKPSQRGGEVEAVRPEVGHSASVWLVEGSTEFAAALAVHKPGPPGARR